MKRMFSPNRRSIWQLALLGLTLAVAPIKALAAPAEELLLANPGVEEQYIKAGNGLELDTLIITPKAESADALGVLVMTHGFLMDQKFYRDLLGQIADQGFVIVAPQAYKPGGLPFGKPTTIVEAQKVAKAIDWFSTHLEEIVKRPVAFDKLGIVSHSRGSKVAWTIARDMLSPVQALAAIDPVDGSQDGSPRITGGDLKVNLPSFIIGTGLGGNGAQACAPANVNYAEFWKTVQTSPSYLFVAKDYGHMDLLDDASKCGLICGLCAKAPAANPRPEFRTWIAKGIGSFMRGVLYQDQTSMATIDVASKVINASVVKL